MVAATHHGGKPATIFSLLVSSWFWRTSSALRALHSEKGKPGDARNGKTAQRVSARVLDTPFRRSCRLMTLDISNTLKVIGPAASIFFAAWIFMGFLQTRYDSAIDRYRDLIDRYRTSEPSGPRKANMRDQIVCYQRRCELMGQANILGLVSA